MFNVPQLNISASIDCKQKKILSLNGRKIIKICEDGGWTTKGVEVELEETTFHS